MFPICAEIFLINIFANKRLCEKSEPTHIKKYKNTVLKKIRKKV